ncbi:MULTISPECIES: PilN domain-containing protein [Candidatus Ichthyocystis]|uniref:Putative type 4 fimbrial protein PilN n=1 Tax=Candidatus Ichthyocystis hellenicum TaxID=1561003 RepID=A0A0S4M4X5_9BURK|nr:MULTISPECIES: PilN domain-containing protein [Ichthyocystis]CUT17341.1 putative type 4 fimbrial protein PilN [Candidatus Ichthyocystis hellenicum]
MMLFNLLPYRKYKEQQDRRIFFAHVAIAAFIAVIISWGVNQLSYFYVKKQDDNVTFLKSEIGSLQSDKLSVKKIGNQIKTILDNRRVIEELNYRKLNLLEILRELAVVVPDGMYLNSFKTTSTGEAEVSGVALSNKIVSDFLHKIDGSKIFTLKGLTHTKILHSKFGVFQEFELVVVKKEKEIEHDEYFPELMSDHTESKPVDFKNLYPV